MSGLTPERRAEMLARLAELDLGAVEHIQAQLTAATDPETINSLGRTYQRAARSLRQTLALDAKLANDAAAAAPKRAPTPPHLEDFETDLRMMEVQEALTRVAHAACDGDAERREQLLERLDLDLDDWIQKPDFTTVDLNDLIQRACERLGIPQDLATTWQDLPDPPIDDEDASSSPPERSEERGEGRERGDAASPPLRQSSQDPPSTG